MKILHAVLTILWCLGPSAVAQVAAPAGEVNAPAPENEGGARALDPEVARPDERRSERPLTVTVFGRPTELRLRYEGEFGPRLNFDLDPERQRDRDDRDHEVKLDARLQASESTTLFAQVVGTAESSKFRSDGSVERSEALERGQTWVLVKEPAGLPISLQAGRIALIDRRSWWWDEDLDAVRLNLTRGPLRVETGLARELAPVSRNHSIDPEAQDVTRWFGEASYRWERRNTLSAFWLFAHDRSGQPVPGSVLSEDDEDTSDGQLRWFGLRAAGETRFKSDHRFGYWLDAAIVRGRETLTSFDELQDGQLRAGPSRNLRVKGHAVDVGAKWSWPGDARPTVTLGWASGSGNFRQTGLQENKSRMSGVKRLRFYGELLDPELSNLRIATIGAGVRFFKNSSSELLLHDYRQRVASTSLAGSRLSPDPLGINPRIGREIDLFIAMREWRNVEFTLLLSRFRPGPAFAPNRRSSAHAVEFGVALNF